MLSLQIMKRNFTSIVLLAAATLFAACGEKTPTPSGSGDGQKEEEQEQAVTVTVPSFAKGADISWVSEMESDGKKFKKRDGTTADILDVLKEVGVNAIRLRVWVDPTGGWSGKDDVVKLAGRATKAGLPVMVDFHYSDFFADPSRQTVPASWSADKADLTQMAKHVADHTTEVLTALKEAGVSPAWIQIGNETRNGMLWPLGQLWAVNGSTPGGWANFTQLYNAGYDAAKAVFPKAVVMPHLNNAFKATDNAWWFGELKKNGGKFDAVALSHYPQYESDWASTQEQALAYIKQAATTLGVPVMVSEVGVKTPANATLAAQVLSEFMTEVQKIDKCAGVFYWEPEVYGGWKPAVYGNADAIYKYTGKRETWNAYDMGAFTAEGKASPVLDAFK